MKVLSFAYVRKINTTILFSGKLNTYFLKCCLESQRVSKKNTLFFLSVDTLFL